MVTNGCLNEKQNHNYSSLPSPAQNRTISNVHKWKWWRDAGNIIASKYVRRLSKFYLANWDAWARKDANNWWRAGPNSYHCIHTPNRLCSNCRQAIHSRAFLAHKQHSHPNQMFVFSLTRVQVFATEILIFLSLARRLRRRGGGNCTQTIEFGRIETKTDDGRRSIGRHRCWIRTGHIHRKYVKFTPSSPTSVHRLKSNFPTL